jgi:hypothetical protein
MMQRQGRAKLVFDLGVAHHANLRHRLAHFIDGFEVAEEIVGEIDVADGRRQLVGFHLLVLGEAWKGEASSCRIATVYDSWRAGTLPFRCCAMKSL